MCVKCICTYLCNIEYRLPDVHCAQQPTSWASPDLEKWDGQGKKGVGTGVGEVSLSNRDGVWEVKSVRNASKSVDGHLRINVEKLHAWRTPSYPSIVTGSASVSGTPCDKVGLSPPRDDAPDQHSVKNDREHKPSASPEFLAITYLICSLCECLCLCVDAPSFQPSFIRSFPFISMTAVLFKCCFCSTFSSIPVL